MYTTLINYIYNRVYDNGNGEINPTKVRQCFQEVANELGLNANFMGIITPSDTPASGDVKMLYLAVPNASDRTFTNFGGSVSVPANSMAIFYYDNDQWNSEVFGIQQATDTLAGIVELATDAETQAGTATDKAVTPHGLAAAVADLDGVLLVTINNNNTASHSRDEIVQAVTDGKAVVVKTAINGNIIPVTVKYTETVAKLERVRIEAAGSGSPYNRISLDTYNIDNSKNVSYGYNHSYASTTNTNAQRDTLTLTVTAADFATAVSQSKLNQGCIYRLSDTGDKYLATSSNTYELLVGDATDTAKGVVELATSAEAEAGTDTERVLTPKTNRDAHDAWHWFGTQAQFDALAPDYDPNVIYHVENTEDTGITLHWTDDVATLASNNQLVTGDMYVKLPTGDTDKRNITNLYMATSSSTYITLWNL